MMNKTFITKAALILALVLVTFAAVPGSLFAADSLVLTVSDAGGDTGDLVEVNVNIDNASGTEGGQFVLNYDHEMLEPIALETGNFLDEASDTMEMANLEYAPGQLMFIWVTAAGDTEESGILSTVTFEVLKEGESLLEIDEIVISPVGIDTEVEPGLVTAPGNDVVAATDADAGNSTSPAVIIGAIAALAIAGYAAYRLMKKQKPGAGQD